MENRDTSPPPSSSAQQDAKATIPVVEEQVDVQKRTVDTGKGVRLHKSINEREEIIDVPVRREACDIQTIPIDRILDEGVIPAARIEGNTTIIPVVEEIIVMQKRLRLKEEIRITRRIEEENETHTVTLKSESVTVEHFDRKNESYADKPLSNSLSQTEPGVAPPGNESNRG